MSWFFAATGAFVRDKNEFEEILPDSRLIFDDDDFFIKAGGIEDNYHKIDIKNPANIIGIVCGLGIDDKQKKKALVETESWKEFLSHENDNRLNNLDGHFCGVVKEGHSVTLFNDSLGVRELYYYEDGGSAIISSRLDLVAKATGQINIFIPALSERWLMQNQLTYDSLIEGIERIGPGGRTKISVLGVERNNSIIEFSNHKSESSEIVSRVMDYFFATPQGMSPVLSISGGLDSRFLLACLIASGKQNIKTIALGSLSNPDNKISSSMTRLAGFDYELFEPPVNENPGLEILRKFSAETMLTAPVFEAADKYFYEELHSRGYFIIDGGIGEIARRGFYNKILYTGQKAFKNLDYTSIYNLLKDDKPDIFRNDVLAVMETAAIEQIEKAFKSLPNITNYSIENWLDLFFVKVRIPNYSGPEQSRVDSYGMSIAPFMQPEMLDYSLNLPLRLKRDAKLFKSIIKEASPVLSKYPLIKAGNEVPFNMGNLPAKAWSRFQKFFSKAKSDRSQRYLNKMKSYVYDTIESSYSKNHELLDANKINKLVESFYFGNETLAIDLEWYLTLDFFLQSLEE